MWRQPAERRDATVRHQFAIFAKHATARTFPQRVRGEVFPMQDLGLKRPVLRGDLKNAAEKRRYLGEFLRLDEIELKHAGTRTQTRPLQYLQ